MVAESQALHRLLHPLDGVSHAPVASSRQPGEPELLRLDDWHVYATRDRTHDRDGQVVSSFLLADGTTADVLVRESGALSVPFDPEEAYRNYLSEAWVEQSRNRHLSASQLALYYRLKHLVPRRAQLWARRQLIRWQGSPPFPAWPVDDSVCRLLELYAAVRLSENGSSSVRFRWFWPDSFQAALVLSHDVETAGGVRLAVELADLEEEHGFRSAFNLGAWYDADPGVLRDLTSRGFEIGMHGIVHDHSLFSSRQEFERQLPHLRELAHRLGATGGFRSPATHRVFDWLAELPIEYDGTIPHSDPYEPQPGGCCTLWPFFIGDVIELPYTLPQDHTLLTLLGDRSAVRWLDAARRIEDRFGLVHCVTHPDPGYLGDTGKRAIYAEFLKGMAERHAVWHALPRAVASWWRLRDSAPANSSLGAGTARQGEAPGKIIFEGPAALATDLD